MKKIFAIALALVMVLSMASAFASQCATGFDWTKAADPNKCGKVTVEVVPYIKVNNGCGGFTYQMSNCAGAVRGEKVYYAVKLTAEANLDEEWLAKAKVKMGLTELKDNAKGIKNGDLVGMKGVKKGEDKQIVYYLSGKAGTFTWVDETTDGFNMDNFIYTNIALDARKTKVCATLTSENKFTEGIVGEYYVVYTRTNVNKLSREVTDKLLVKTWQDANTSETFAQVTIIRNGNAIEVNKEYAWEYNTATNTYGITYKQDGGEDKFVEIPAVGEYELTNKYSVDVADGNAYLMVYSKKGGTLLVTYTIKDEKIHKIDYTQACGEAQYATIKAYFGLDIGTTITDKLIKKNFGWDDEVKSCFQWNKDAVAIVNPECQIEIPKTGDVSVVAYAVLALVAAAGAMGLKK